MLFLGTGAAELCPNPLCGCDTGLWGEENLAFFRDWQADVLIMEGTHSSHRMAPDAGHLNAEHFVLQCENFLRYGVITPRTRVYVTHISQVDSFTHAEFGAYLDEHAPLPVTVAADGLAI